MCLQANDSHFTKLSAQLKAFLDPIILHFGKGILWRAPIRVSPCKRTFEKNAQRLLKQPFFNKGLELGKALDMLDSTYEPCFGLFKHRRAG